MKTPTTKKFAAIGLVLITCLPGVLYIFLQIQQVYIRHRMDKIIEKNIHLDKAIKINQHGYQEIEIAESALVWYEEGREIVVEGTMMDVISIRKEGGIAFITGIFDYDETDVLQKVGKLNKQSQKEKEGSLAAKFISIVFYSEFMPTFDLSSFTIPLTHNVYWVFQLTDPVHEIHSPPPRIV